LKRLIRSGNCGLTQPGSKDYPSGFFTRISDSITGRLRVKKRSQRSHFLCNHFYASAFDHDFVANNQHHCKVKIPENMPENFKMGYMETRRR
jgi:hypothetical protein